MEKFAGLFTALVLTCGLSLAQDDAQKPATPVAQSTSTSSQPATGAVVQSWHGILVDGSCAGGGGASASSSASTESQSGSDSTKSVDTGRPHKGHKNHSAEAQSCPVSSSTGMFALKTGSGQVMKFDMVGNARAAEILKTKPAWTKKLGENKPIKARVTGALNGDTITVTEIG